ncbi:MAG: anti-sigma factor antagonist [Lachnospiraceae bacterium]|nr:anti-sigma factor antagonist [Lachnospiraceae bacterium]
MEWMEVKGSRLVVSLPPELDHHYTEEIRTEIDRMVSRQPVDEVEFDFTRTVFMDSAGIGMLIGRYKVMKALNGRIRLSHMNGQIRRILSLSGIQRYIQLDGEEAV